MHSITLHDLLRGLGDRDVATIVDVIEMRRIMRKGPPEVGHAEFHA